MTTSHPASYRNVRALQVALAGFAMLVICTRFVIELPLLTHSVPSFATDYAELKRFVDAHVPDARLGYVTDAPPRDNLRFLQAQYAIAPRILVWKGDSGCQYAVGELRDPVGLDATTLQGRMDELAKSHHLRVVEVLRPGLAILRTEQEAP